MKVHELIKHLQKMPNESEVIFRTLDNDYGFWNDKPILETSTEHRMGIAVFCSDEQLKREAWE